MNTLITISMILSISTCGGVKTGRMLGLDGGTYNALFEINLDTGEGVDLFSFEFDPGGGSLAVAPNGALYASFVSDLKSLVIVDMDTGEVNIVGAFGFNSVSGLAFGPDGTLYGIDDTTNQFLNIDAQTGASTVVGPTGVVSNQGLASRLFDGTLYMVGTPSLESILYIVDPLTGQAAEIGPFGSNLESAASVETIGDVFYASASDPFDKPYDVLVTLDPQTGEATKIGGFCPFSKDCPYMHGLAFLPGAGDGDRDGDVDVADVEFFEACFGPLDEPGKSPYCAFLDSDKDGDLDCIDWEAFIPNWTEDTEPPTFPTCDDPPPCEGDANGDAVVDPLDSGYVLSRFGCSVGTGDAACDAADVNADSLVDPLDSGFVLARFGECPN